MQAPHPAAQPAVFRHHLGNCSTQDLPLQSHSPICTVANVQAFLRLRNRLQLFVLLWALPRALPGALPGALPEHFSGPPRTFSFELPGVILAAQLVIPLSAACASASAGWRSPPLTASYTRGASTGVTMAFERCTREARGGRHVFFPRIPSDARCHDATACLSAAGWVCISRSWELGSLQGGARPNTACYWG